MLSKIKPILKKIGEFFNNIWLGIRKFVSDEKRSNYMVPLIAIILGFLFGSLIMVVTGRNPLDIFSSLLRGTAGIDVTNIGTDKPVFNARYIGEFLVASMPIILTGLSVAFAFRTGLFNIGAEGQLMLGSFGAVFIGVLVGLPEEDLPRFLRFFADVPSFFHLPLAVITGALFGALWGFVPGYLKGRFNVHEVVVTIMMNYVALNLTNYLYKQLPGSTNVRTVDVAESASLESDFLSNLTNGSRLHWGFIIVIIAVVSFWLIINKTTFGFELKSAGFNKHASKYAGMKVNRNIVLSMGIAGAFAGLGGVVLALGTFDYGRVLPSAEGYGFDGIAVALVGGITAIGSVFSGLLFGALKASQPLMQARGIPRDIASIIIASIVIFVAMQAGIKHVLKRMKIKEKENI